MEPRESEARALSERFEQLYGHKLELVKPEADADTGARPALVLVGPGGVKASSIKGLLDEFRTAPERVKGTAAIGDVDSFTAHIGRFGREQGTAVFANPDREAPHMIAVYDYSTRGEPAFHHHRAKYSCLLSEQWQRWLELDSEFITQADFAAFLEDRIQDVITPDTAGEDSRAHDLAILMGGSFATPARLIELSRGLNVRSTQKVEQKVNLSSGEATLVYQESHEDGGLAGGEIRVPNFFMVAIPVFYAGQAYRIPVRLRYRIAGGKVLWGYAIHRPDLVFEDAFKGLVEKVATTGYPVFIGAPES